MKFYVVEEEKEKTFKFGTSRKTFKGNFVVESGATAHPIRERRPLREHEPHQAPATQSQLNCTARAGGEPYLTIKPHSGVPNRLWFILFLRLLLFLALL